MKMIVEIRRNADGLVRCNPAKKDIPLDTDGEHNFFIWSDGNDSCDCNRNLYFARFAGEPDPDVECGDDRYSVRLTADDGTFLYSDGEWP